MIFYTVMPMELVFGSGTEAGQQQVESVYLGRQVVTMADGSGCRRIVRLLSTDPQDYLDPRFFPGTMIQA